MFEGRKEVSAVGVERLIGREEGDSQADYRGMQVVVEVTIKVWVYSFGKEFGLSSGGNRKFIGRFLLRECQVLMFVQKFYFGVYVEDVFCVFFCVRVFKK